MSALLRQFVAFSIEDSIQQHPAWVGHISGLKADKLLRGNKVPYRYILRAGEGESDYYVTYTLPDGTIKHTPFVLTDTAEGWYYENGGGNGPYVDATIDDVLHLIMHCAKEDCIPLAV